SLEARQLLAAQVFGIDQDGDTWSLRLVGPGDVHVFYQDGTPATATASGQIDSIVVSGTDSLTSRLVGRVARGSINGTPGDGRVFFQRFLETDGRALPALDPTQRVGVLTPGNGIQAVDIPNFWLGHTSTTAPAGANGMATEAAGSIQIPDGVITLRFGGVDSTFTPPGGMALNANTQGDQFVVDLGLPFTQGTSVIADRFVSSAQAAQGTTGSPTQDRITVSVTGRLNLFQANAIQGTTNPADLIPSQFDVDAATAAPGGTIVISQGSPAASVTGQIGDVRIGGNATNFTVVAVESALSNPGADENAKVSNFSVGGETENVLLVAPGGSRNIFFGKGMDQVLINSNFISHLQANRGALNSNVTVNRKIDQVILGGDVVNTNVQSGYAQFLSQIANAAIQGTAPPTIANRQLGVRNTFNPLAQNGGNMTVRIAGDVVDSVFSASVEPNPGLQPLPGTTDQGDPGVFGDRDATGRLVDVIFPAGTIHAQVEGNIDNTNNPLVDPEAAGQAFFANEVRVQAGPVVPPNVPEAPYPRDGIAPNAPRVVRHLQPQRLQDLDQVVVQSKGRSKAPAATTPGARATSHPRPPRAPGSSRRGG
ncbi:MAG TPA: hypothetical protein VF590_26025, partial [Isosphaeraceae bacterium]